MCPLCHEPIELGENAVEIFLGILARGERSGNPVINQDPLLQGPAIVHTWCAPAFVAEYVFPDDGEDSEPVYCEKCGVEVDGGDED
jgi:hypothetical protein